MIVQVSGPPCAGKSTFIRAHAQPGDLVLDDVALAGKGRDRITDRAWASWWRVLDTRIARHRGPGTLWFVQGRPVARRVGVVVRVLNPGRAECHRRADAAGRPQDTHTWIDTWFDKYTSHRTTGP